MARTSLVTRRTRETELKVELNLDEFNEPLVETDLPFFNHMLEQLGKHSGMALRVEGTGDVQVDSHHLVEDVGLAMGEAINQALGERRGIRRYASLTLPLDEALIRASLDISGRGLLDYQVEQSGDVEGFPLEVIPEFFRSLAVRGRMTLHLDQLKGTNRHHIAEATFKAVARVLGSAVQVVEGSIPSTKGTLTE